MKNALFISILLLFHAILLIHSDVITKDHVPNAFSECKDDEKADLYKCIIPKFDNLEWISGTSDEMQLRIRQDFYWHPTRRVRRECRALHREEWLELVDAINTLKKDKVSKVDDEQKKLIRLQKRKTQSREGQYYKDELTTASLSPNVYDNFAAYHTKSAIEYIHFGPGFFGWHRLFILKFEELLRKVNPNITLCYWDSRLDHVMKFPPASIMFTEEFMGNMHGPITKGPFAGWRTITGERLERKMGESGQLISPEDINTVLSKKHHVQITTPTSDDGANVESMHNMVHAFIGGQMNDFNTSSDDPFFFFHHAFIDSVWEKFCTQLRERGIDPQDDYVIGNDPKHHPDTVMKHLFPLKNVDGYSDYFPRNIYEYQEYATCPDCLNSPLLKCDNKIWKCRTIERWEPRRDVKLPPQIETNHLSKPQHEAEVLSGKEHLGEWVFVPIKLIFKDAVPKYVRSNNITNCEYLDSDPELCSESVVIVQSNGISYKGTYRNYIINDVCIPQWTYAYVAVKNPEIGASEAYISITDKTGEPCLPYCLSEEDGKYLSCPGVISLTTDKPKMYSHTIEDIEDSGFVFDPLQADTMDTRVKMSFLCY